MAFCFCLRSALLAFSAFFMISYNNNTIMMNDELVFRDNRFVFGQMTLRHSPVISPLLKPEEYIIIIPFVYPSNCIAFQLSHTLTLLHYYMILSFAASEIWH